MCNRAACSLASHDLQVAAKRACHGDGGDPGKLAEAPATAAAAAAHDKLAEDLAWSSASRVWEPSYAIRPTNPIPVLLRGDNGHLALDVLRWGLVPPYHTGDPREFKLATFNCRVEGLAEAKVSRVFGPPMSKGQRCVVLVTGFFEWHDSPDSKQPYFLRHPTEPLLLLAGLYEKTESAWSCTMVTVPSRPDMEWLNDRTPAVLATPGAITDWLERGSISSLAPLPAIRCHPVARSAGSGRPTDASLVEPVVLELRSQTKLTAWLTGSPGKKRADKTEESWSACSVCTAIHGPHALQCAECGSIVAPDEHKFTQYTVCTFIATKAHAKCCEMCGSTFASSGPAQAANPPRAKLMRL